MNHTLSGEAIVQGSFFAELRDFHYSRATHISELANRINTLCDKFVGERPSAEGEVLGQSPERQPGLVGEILASRDQLKNSVHALEEAVDRLENMNLA